MILVPLSNSGENAFRVARFETDEHRRVSRELAFMLVNTSEKARWPEKGFWLPPPVMWCSVEYELPQVISLVAQIMQPGGAFHFRESISFPAHGNSWE
jgi:hypothetical protein